MSLLLAAGVPIALAGVASDAASGTGALALATSIAGTSGGTSAGRGALTVVRGLGGSAQVSVGDIGALSTARALGGTTQARASGTGELFDAERTAGTSQAATSGRGALLVGRRVAGTSQSGGAGRGRLDVTSPVVIDPAGTSQAFSGAYGALTVTTATPRYVASSVGGGNPSPPPPPKPVVAAKAWGSLATWLKDGDSGARAFVGHAAARSPADPRAGVAKQLTMLSENLGRSRDGTLMARAAAGSAVWVPLDRWGGRATARAAGNATGTRVLLAYGAEYAAARHAELTAEPTREAASASPLVEWPVVDVPELAPIDAPEAAPAAPDAPSLWPEVIAATLALAALGGLAHRFGETRPKRRRKRR